MQQQNNQNQSNTTEFWYHFNMQNNTADFGFGNTHAGTIFLPYLNAKQMHIEAAIEMLRLIERGIVRYHMYTVGNAASDTMLMTGYAFAHEYGHMLHAVLNEKYGATNFSNGWTALNGGLKYGMYEYNNLLYEKTFVRDYAATNLSEDVAETYGLFVNDQLYIRRNYNDLKDANLWKKAMLLESIAKSMLKVDCIYLPYYIPQTPSSWAEDAVKRGFYSVTEEAADFAAKYGGDPWLRGIFRGGDWNPDCLLYQASINRAEFCDYLIEMLNSVCVERYGSYVFSGERISLGDGVITVNVLNPITGKKTMSVKMNNPFTDCNNENVTYANYLGIVSGVNATEFNPTEKLTREQAAVFMEKACAVLGIADKGGASPVPTDAASISAWAKSGVEFAMRNGIMSGTGGGAFSPKQAYSYEQAYVTLIKLYDMAVAIPTA